MTLRLFDGSRFTAPHHHFAGGNTAPSPVSATANITTTNATGGNVQLQIVSRGAFANTIANQAFTYTITQGTGLTLGNTTTSMFGNTILANASALATISNVVLGGRSGRINRETLVYVRSMANNATSGGGSTTP